MLATLNGVNTARAMKKQSLSPQNFLKVASFIQDNYGIKMPPSKKTMVNARLQKRMRRAGFSSANQYVDFCFSTQGQGTERLNMVDAITTNKTDFFQGGEPF